MKFKKPFYFTLLFMIFSFSLSSGQSIKNVNIGMVIDGPWGEENEMLKSIKREIVELTTGEFDVQFKPLQADWTISEIRKAIDQLLADQEVDLIITLGSISSNEACHQPGD